MTLLEKISEKQALIGIIGLGYVGLPLVLRFGEVGFKILGFDSDIQKVEKLNRGRVLYQTYFRMKSIFLNIPPIIKNIDGTSCEAERYKGK